MSADAYLMTALTGNTENALDSIAGDVLSDGAAALTFTTTGLYAHILDADNGGAADGVSIIEPVTNAGDKRWVLVNFFGGADAAAARALLGLGTAAVLDAAGGSGDLLREVLDSAPSTDHAASGPQASLTAGEAVVFGEVCYVKSDGKLWKSDADAATTMPAMFMALATIGADAAGLFMVGPGFVRDDTWAWTVGGLIYADTTAGALSQTAPTGSGDQRQVVGIATHADRMYFCPCPVLVEVA